MRDTVLKRKTARKLGPFLGRGLGLGLCLGLAACGGGPREYSRASFNGPLQCAPYARAKTGVALYGAASSWWRGASGKYRRTQTPAQGEILVFRSTGRLPSGHVSVVRSTVSSRKILVEHANWEPGRIDRSVPVIDVSPGNDWSLVRVYWAPIRNLGARAYPTYGFIVPRDLDDIARLQVARDHAM
ncbi:CHAP domain-containing protein [Asaia sp. As-1742]|nr:CHAP domain-containing protein [Asaia sp. As-1742]